MEKMEIGKYSPNLGDIFRRDFGALTEYQKSKIQEVKELADQLLARVSTASCVLEASFPDRCLDQFQARLEEAVMWAVKGIATTGLQK